ncbi:MAG: DUF3108 domain-containing protein [Bacteroidota bacterium]|nr:DUF3108 domain-containing protein [bacterium]NBP63778.1 DUF3108 domain-containing protein [Bacteroidota bacterium]
MHVCKKLAVFIIVTFLTAFSSNAQVMSSGEELVYDVSYMGITLGTIRVTTLKNETFNGKSVHHTKIYIDSRKGIPFVDLHSIYESWIDPSVQFSHNFAASTKESDGSWTYDKYLFDYPGQAVTMEKYKANKLSNKRVLKTSKKWNDGSSLFFLARQMLKSKKTIKVPTIIMDDTVSTSINFVGKEETVEIDAAKYPIKTIYLSGTANWTGIYGLSGKFEGWFSDDEARIPIRAKMKLYVGNANIELVKWNRSSWQPPKAE